MVRFPFRYGDPRSRMYGGLHRLDRGTEPTWMDLAWLDLEEAFGQQAVAMVKWMLRWRRGSW